MPLLFADRAFDLRISPHTTVIKRMQPYDVTLPQSLYLQHGGGNCSWQNDAIVTPSIKKILQHVTPLPQRFYFFSPLAFYMFLYISIYVSVYTQQHFMIFHKISFAEFSGVVSNFYIMLQAVLVPMLRPGWLAFVLNILTSRMSVIYE